MIVLAKKKALLIMAIALVAPVMSSGFLIVNTARSQDTEPADLNRMFLFIDTIYGESMDKNHIGSIDIEAFDWSEAMAVIVSVGVTSGRLIIKDFCFVARTSMASPKLFVAVATGEHMKTAQLDVCREIEENQVKLLEFKFLEVEVTSYSINGTTLDYGPLDHFSIAFGKITMTCWQIEPDESIGASVSAWYDLVSRRLG